MVRIEFLNDWKESNEPFDVKFIPPKIASPKKIDEFAGPINILGKLKNTPSPRPIFSVLVVLLKQTSTTISTYPTLSHNMF